MFKVLLFVIASAPLCLGGCGQHQKADSPNGQPHHLNITVDPRMELMSVVEILSDYGSHTGLITRFDLTYKKDVETCFAPYKNHPAVALFKELSAYPYSFRFSTPPRTMLQLSNPPELAVQSAIPGVVYSLSGGKSKLGQFLEQLRDFAAKSNFMTFYDAHRDFYAGMVNSAYAQVSGVGVIPALEDYLGMSRPSYNIIIVPLQSGSFGLEEDDGGLYNICGPDSLANDTPYVRGVRDICWHEFGHSFVNPVAEKYISRLRRDSALFLPIASRMHCAGNDDFASYIYEHVLRAVNVRMVALNLGESEVEKAIRGHRSVGFVYVSALAERLKEYEARRDKYPTFEDFFPRIVDAFDELAQSKLSDSFYAQPFTGTIRSVVCDYPDVFIVPTHENSERAQMAIRQHVEKMRDTYHRGSLILTDDEALATDLSNRSLLVFGTPEGNSWLSVRRESLPFTIDANVITVDGSSYPGNRLRLIATLGNPGDNSKGVAVFTAQRAEDIPGSYLLPFSWSDYIVAEDNRVQKWGSYRRAHSGQVSE